jgi:hypothetical protein
MEDEKFVGYGTGLARKMAEARSIPPKRAGAARGFAAFALSATAVVPAIAAFVFFVTLPAAHLVWHHEAATSTPTKTPDEGARADTGDFARERQIESLRLDEAYWNARISLGKQKTISLAVDLVDSVASLDIRGVPVRNCRIIEYRKSHALPYAMRNGEFREQFSKPLVVRRESATLPKEPIRVTFAPKDSVEAAEAAAEPIEPEQADVYVTMYFDGGLSLALSQFERPASNGLRERIKVRLKEGLREAQEAVRLLARKQIPQHELRIELTLSREDAKAIYRALGPNARVAFRL